MSYTPKFHRNVEKQLRRIPNKQRARLVTNMRALREDPRPTSNLKLDDVLYRFRQGRHCIINAVFEEELVVVLCKAARRAADTCRELNTLLERA